MTTDTLTTEELAALRAPFALEKHSVKIQSYNKEKTKAMAVTYIDARDVMDRLDAVAGARWSDSYKAAAGEKGVECTIAIGGISRTDVGDDDNDNEQTKSGYSDAFKRAGVKWGIGRYLYDLPKVWLTLDETGQRFLSDKQKTEALRGVVQLLARLKGQPQPQAKVEQKVETGSQLPTQAEAHAELEKVKAEAQAKKLRTEAQAARTQTSAAAQQQPLEPEQPPVEDEPDGFDSPAHDGSAAQAPATHAQAQPAEYTEGLFTFRMNGQVKEIKVGPKWYPANDPTGPKGLTAAQKEKIHDFFIDAKGIWQGKHMEAHLDKYFHVKTIPALTWHGVLAIVAAFGNPPRYDPAFYQVKLDELAAKAIKEQAKAEPLKVPANTAAKLAKTFKLEKDDELIAELAMLEGDVLNALSGLYAKRKWGADKRDGLGLLLTLINTGSASPLSDATEDQQTWNQLIESIENPA